MGLLRNHRSSLSQRSVPHSSNRRRNSEVTSLSQPVPSTSRNTHSSQQLEESILNRMISEEENELVNKLIRYFFILDRGKQVISKAHIIKNVFGNKGKHFHHIINKVKALLSKVFGLTLIELQGNKYMLANELENQLLHISPIGTQGSQQVLLFIVLTHIFMCEECCSEESLWSFLTNLDILCSDNQYHKYFGNVRYLISEVFVAQKYLEKLITNTNDSMKVEYKWGPRAEYEFSRRAALEFVSQVYYGRPMNSWPLQYKTLQTREKANKS